MKKSKNSTGKPGTRDHEASDVDFFENPRRVVGPGRPRGTKRKPSETAAGRDSPDSETLGEVQDQGGSKRARGHALNERQLPLLTDVELRSIAKQVEKGVHKKQPFSSDFLRATLNPLAQPADTQDDLASLKRNLAAENEQLQLRYEVISSMHSNLQGRVRAAMSNLRLTTEVSNKSVVAGKKESATEKQETRPKVFLLEVMKTSQEIVASFSTSNKETAEVLLTRALDDLLARTFTEGPSLDAMVADIEELQLDTSYVDEGMIPSVGHQESFVLGPDFSFPFIPGDERADFGDAPNFDIAALLSSCDVPRRIDVMLSTSFRRTTFEFESSIPIADLSFDDEPRDFETIVSSLRGIFSGNGDEAPEVEIFKENSREEFESEETQESHTGIPVPEAILELLRDDSTSAMQLSLTHSHPTRLRKHAPSINKKHIGTTSSLEFIFDAENRVMGAFAKFAPGAPGNGAKLFALTDQFLSLPTNLVDDEACTKISFNTQFTNNDEPWVHGGVQPARKTVARRAAANPFELHSSVNPQYSERESSISEKLLRIGDVELDWEDSFQVEEFETFNQLSGSNKISEMSYGELGSFVIPLIANGSVRSLREMVSGLPASTSPQQCFMALVHLAHQRHSNRDNAHTAISLNCAESTEDVDIRPETIYASSRPAQPV